MRFNSDCASASSAPPAMDSSAIAVQTGANRSKIHGATSRKPASSENVAISTSAITSAAVIGAALAATSGSQK